MNNVLNLQESPSSGPVFDARDDGVRVAINEDGTVAYASASFCELVRGALGDMQGSDIAGIFSFAGEGVTHETVVDSDIQNIVIKSSGELLDFRFEWLVTPDNRRYLIGAPRARDGQAILQAEPLTQEDFRILDGLSEDVSMVLNRDGTIIRSNSGAHTIFGACYGKGFEGLFPREEREGVSAVLQSLKSGDTGRQGLSFETTMPVRAGVGHVGAEQRMQWHVRMRGRQIYARGQDVTHIKQQEEARARRERELTQAESIGRMGHWHWTVGADDVEWSPELYTIFGVVADDFTPTLDTITAMIGRRDMPRVSQNFQRALLGQNTYDMDFRITAPDGSSRYIHCEGRCELDTDGDVIALYGIMQDVTERALHEKELMQAKRGAERAYAAKTQFLANMSHELRTPLNAIIGFSEMMQQQLLGPIGNEKYLEYIGGIRESGGHLLDLISDILDMSKIEAGKYDLALEEFKIYKTLRMAVHMMEGRARDGGVKLSFAVQPPEDLSLVADRRAFMQIVLNLLSNAVKFTRDKGAVSLECHQRDNYLAIKIIDTGIGIPANKLATITRPFEQVSNSYAREHEGSGLGLAITKDLVEMHGGNMHIESAVNRGTTVTVRLPYDAHEAIAASS